MHVKAEAVLVSFAYQAQTREGQALSGTIDASDVDQATRRLETLGLKVILIAPAPGATRARALRGEDFLAFNQQLAHLTKAGLPLEHGLRLIAQDMRSGGLSRTVRQIADALEAGQSLSEALAEHRGRFPSLYAKLVDAGVRANNLPGVLFSLTRHLEMLRRLRAMLWRAAAYPIMVFLGLGLVLAFIGLWILPAFETMLTSFRVPMPAATRWLMKVARLIPMIGIVLGAIVVTVPIAWAILRSMGREGAAMDRLVLPLPLLGPVVKRNLVAGWCDVMRMAVEAGVDLPAAIDLAGHASGSPALRRDGERLIRWLEEGGDVKSAGAAGIRHLPPTVIASIALGMENHDLPATLKGLSEMYQEQAETRLNLLPGILSPLLLLLVAATIGVVVLVGLILPMMALIKSVSGSPW